MAAGVDRLEALKPKIESIPWFNWAKNLLAEYLGNDKNQEELVNLILKKSGGVFSMTAGFFGTLFAIGFDLLLSIFFFSYFLQKMASFNSGGKTGETTGEYIVKSFFDSNWLPKTSLETRKEAREILDNIIMKLKTWVRGYFTIITIESFIYVVGFSRLRIPYSVPLGLIAGCTILLPFIGPLASALLTILVCFAVGGASTSMVTILAIILMYCLMNGIIEQLFLYPAVVGEALGLNTLETIIVVLLGGLFGGIAGMIFAVPAASVLKYLFPKIYQCWRH
jgi:predicted PurR-regulated permease PerM